jgi:hypothetical protein
MRRALRTTLTAFALLPALAACGVGRAPRTTTTASNGAVELRKDEFLVRVNNSYQGIVDVYAVGRGIVDRLGTASLGSPSTFRVRLTQFPPSTPIQIIARPVGGSGVANSGPLQLSGGEVVEFSVNGLLAGSVLIR